MSRQQHLKPSIGNRAEESERRMAALEQRVRGMPVRHTAGGSAFKPVLISKTAHAWAVGDVLRLSGGTWTKAQADTPENAAWDAVVSAVLGPDAAEAVLPGSYIASLSSRTSGSMYFLSSSTAGATTTTAPTHIMPIYRAVSATEAILVARRACHSVSTSDPGSTAAVDGDLWFKY